MDGGKHPWLLNYRRPGDVWVEDVWLMHEWQKSGWVVLGDAWFI